MTAVQNIEWTLGRHSINSSLEEDSLDIIYQYGVIELDPVSPIKVDLLNTFQASLS